MSFIELTSKGNYDDTIKFLNKLKDTRTSDIYEDLDRYGRMGVDALAQATPVDTGLTAQSWEYRIIFDNRGPGIEWYNTNEEYGRPVAILIQYGHGTRGGSYIQGIDYINPAIRPIFDQIAEDVWKKVKL